MRSRAPSMVAPLAAAVLLTACGVTTESARPEVQPPGQPRTAKTTTLETGANVLQDTTPVDQIGIYLVGFHPLKDRPEVQFEAHHYCNQVNQDFAQCVLFDGNTEAANLNGIEYIISEKLYESLPEEERRYWHPHNYEILSGQLVGPGLPQAAEQSLMKDRMNSYGKTWHTWNTATPSGAADQLPMGDPHLAWSFNRDGEAMPGLVQRRDQALGVDTVEKRKVRADLAQYAHPQGGVDALAGAFPNAQGAPPGVTSGTGGTSGTTKPGQGAPQQ